MVLGGNDLRTTRNSTHLESILDLHKNHPDRLAPYVDGNPRIHLNAITCESEREFPAVTRTSLKKACLTTHCRLERSQLPTHLTVEEESACVDAGCHRRDVDRRSNEEQDLSALPRALRHSGRLNETSLSPEESNIIEQQTSKWCIAQPVNTRCRRFRDTNKTRALNNVLLVFQRSSKEA